MLNEAYRITARDPFTSDVRWTAPAAGSVSWVFVNGTHFLGPMFFDTAERSVRIPFRPDEVMKVEIHDFDDDRVTAEPIEVKPNTRPLLIWNAVPEAKRFRTYHRPAGQITETVIYDRPVMEGIERYEITCPVKLEGTGGVWHFLRVEAVDEFGNESTRKSWTYFVMDLPEAPEGLKVTEGAAPGTYNFEVS